MASYLNAAHQNRFFYLLNFLTVGHAEKVELLHCAKFQLNRFNRGRDMAIFWLFKMAAAAILDFWNLKFLTVGTIKKVETCHRAKFHKNRLNRGQNIVIFQDGEYRHLGFSKFQFFNGHNGQKFGTTSLCQILSKSFKTWSRCSEFSIFQDGGRRQLELSKCEILTLVTVKTVELHQCAKFHRNRSNRGR